MISSRSIAWFRDRCWTLSLRSENASLSMSMSFLTAPKLADTFFSIWFVDFSMILYGFDIYKVLSFCNSGITTERNLREGLIGVVWRRMEILRKE